MQSLSTCTPPGLQKCQIPEKNTLPGSFTLCPILVMRVERNLLKSMSGASLELMLAKPPVGLVSSEYIQTSQEGYASVLEEADRDAGPWQ
eukprot:1160929-Pelagomonas_calceolata.AAC.11